MMRRMSGLIPRLAALAYGVFCYLIQLAALLYAIGFLANTAVPKGIDEGVAASLPVSIGVNLLLVALFGLQHSLMARDGFKRAWTRLVPEPVERSTYVLLTGLTLAAIYIFWRPLPGVVWSLQDGWLSYAAWLLYLIGWGITLSATFMHNHYDLLGLRQVWRFWQGKPVKDAPFRERALYKHIRHPLMLGLLIAFWSTPHMTWGHLLFAAGMSIYIFVGVAFEERDLLQQHGEKYRRFRQERPMLIPRVKR